jgi:hypothetical protein
VIVLAPFGSVRRGNVESRTKPLAMGGPDADALLSVVTAWSHAVYFTTRGGALTRSHHTPIRQFAFRASCMLVALAVDRL